MLWNGSIRDTSNHVSDKYLQINNCGIHNISENFITVRKNGRLDYLLCMVAEGSCTAFYNGEAYELQAGNFLIYCPHEEQKYIFSEGSISIWCHFTGTAVAELMESAELCGGVLRLKKDETIFKLFCNMIRQFHTEKRKKFAIPLLIELLYSISDEMRFSASPKYSEAISRVLLYLHTNYKKSITLGELAELAGYSSSRFSHLFVQECGTTPIAYQNTVRLNAACEILLSTDMTVAETALSCGFNDPLYFSRIFKRKYNLSPSEYRRRAIARQELE